MTPCNRLLWTLAILRSPLISELSVSLQPPTRPTTPPKKNVGGREGKRSLAGKNGIRLLRIHFCLLFLTSFSSYKQLLKWGQIHNIRYEIHARKWKIQSRGKEDSGRFRAGRELGDDSTLTFPSWENWGLCLWVNPTVAATQHRARSRTKWISCSTGKEARDTKILWRL